MQIFNKLYKKLKQNKRFAAFVGLLGLIAVYILIRLAATGVTRLSGKIDDWKYSPQMTQNINIMDSLAIIIITNLLLVGNLTYKLFRKYIWADKPAKIKIFSNKFFAYLSFSALIIVTTVFIYQKGIVGDWILLPTAITMLISALASALYLLITIIRGIIRAASQKSNKDFFKRVGISILGTVHSGLVIPLIILSILLPSMLSPIGRGGAIQSTGLSSTNFMPSAVDYSVGSSPFGSNQSVTENIGYATGGAKDVNNFRENVQNDYMPIYTDLTYEGLFYDYYFETGQKEACQDLFCPSYSLARSSDPISGEDEYYMSVGLNSGIKKEDFERKNLNLVVVLDISGSMSSSFNTYYYDDPEKNPPETKTKMQIANESVANLLDHLRPEDRFGMVLFDDQAYEAKPISQVNMTDIKSLQSHILEVQPQGGTNMESGLKMASRMLEEYKDSDAQEYENRIIFLTDAMPNIGNTGDENFLSITKQNADNRTYSTFIGIGVDFNTELVEKITKVKGANYYSVHNSEEFKYRMAEGFEYMVTPLVFDLKLEFESDNYEIEKVYGSPEANQATGEIMKVNTLFPSDSQNQQNKGGLILLKLKRTDSEDGDISLEVSYKDRSGKSETSSDTISGFENIQKEYFENSGIQKGILLTRYASLIKSWIIDTHKAQSQPEPQPIVDQQSGIPADTQELLGEWERQSVPLEVSSHYRDMFDLFKRYFEEQMDQLEDQDLQKELEILDKLTN